MCDAICSNFRPSETALALLCSAFDTGVVRLNPNPPPAHAVLSLVSFIAELQQRADVSLGIEFICFCFFHILKEVKVDVFLS